MEIVEKMQNWDTWEDIVKDSDPFLNDMSTRFLNGDFSCLDKFDDLKKVVARLCAEFDKESEKSRAPVEAVLAAVREMCEIYKMIDDRDKFDNLLTSETELNNLDKRFIIRKWNKRVIGTKVDKCLVSETIEERLKRKSVEVSEARFKVDQLEPRKRMIGEYVQRAEDLQLWIELYIDAYGWPQPPSPSPSPSSSSSSSPPTNKRDNIGSSSSPSNKRVKHNIGSTSSLDESFVLPC